MINNIRICTTDCADPYRNLALEKYLLDNTPEDACTLYLWQNQNTVVIGRNQNPWAECRCALLEEEGGHLARRLSGGGAVFHDLGNLNFTFLCAAENYDLARQLAVIRAACDLCGIRTELSGRNDILADGRKFSGNAFYNAKGKAYHHGTILIEASTEKMQRYLTPPKRKLEAKGVKSVKSRVVNLTELVPTLDRVQMRRAMAEAFQSVYGKQAELCPEPPECEIAALAAEYGSWDYLYGNAAPFSLSCEERFPWGSVQLQLNVESGVICAAKLYTDAMDWQLSEKTEAALTNCRFVSADLQAALKATLPADIAADLSGMLEKQEL